MSVIVSEEAATKILRVLPSVPAHGRVRSRRSSSKSIRPKFRHELKIDTCQLDRYLTSRPPLPIYYVFPLPHWTGSLTSRSGSAPVAPSAMAAAPPEWWRQRIGSQWFGEWLYVMPAKSVSEALPANWRARKRAKLFSLDTAHSWGRTPPWTELFARTPGATPLLWKQFRTVVTSRCGPPYGVRWRTVAADHAGPDRLLLLSVDEERPWRGSHEERLRRSDEEHLWDGNLDALLDVGASPDQARSGLTREAVVEDGTERAVLHIPDSALS